LNDTAIYKKFYAPQRSLRSWQIELERGAARPNQGEERWVRSQTEWFRNEELEGVEAITVFGEHTDTHELDKKLPRFTDLSRLSALKFLSIPVDALPYIDWNSISDQLLHLHLTAPRSGSIWDSYKSGSLPPFPSLIFPRLITMRVPCPPTGWSGFAFNSFPNLEWFHVELDEFDKTGKCLKQLEKCSALQGIGIDSIKGSDILKNVRDDVTALDIWSITSKKFNFTFLSRFRKLRYLRLRGSATLFDCEALEQLSELEELEVSSCQEVTKTAALLRLKKLTDVRVRLNRSSDLEPKTKMELAARKIYCQWD
jgi:hypothetical protein